MTLSDSDRRRVADELEHVDPALVRLILANERTFAEWLSGRVPEVGRRAGDALEPLRHSLRERLPRRR
jgi:hypothetical protein